MRSYAIILYLCCTMDKGTGASQSTAAQQAHLGQDLPDDLLVALRLRPGQHQQGYRA